MLIVTGVKAAATTNVTINANGSPALMLAVPAGAKVSTVNVKTEIQTKGMDLFLWPIESAKTVDEGVAQIPKVIEHEVLKFVAKTTNTITVAGADAKHLVGRGVEADDHDPATADIVVFTTGMAVFAACVHGEGNEASVERAPMLAVLKTAKAP